MILDELYRQFPKSKLQLLNRFLCGLKWTSLIIQFLNMQFKNKTAGNTIIKPRRINLILDVLMLFLVQTVIFLSLFLI